MSIFSIPDSENAIFPFRNSDAVLTSILTAVSSRHSAIKSHEQDGLSALKTLAPRANRYADTTNSETAPTLPVETKAALVCLPVNVSDGRQETLQYS